MDLAADAPVLVALAIGWAVLRRVPAFLVSATAALGEVRVLAREGRAAVRAVTSAAELGTQVMRHHLQERGIEPEARDPRDSDELTIVRHVTEGRVERALAELERLPPDDSLPLHLGQDARTILELLRKAKREAAPERRDRESSGLRRAAAKIVGRAGILLLLVLLLAGCPVQTDPTPPTGDTGGLSCPGWQCECPCTAPLFCGPHGACTARCRDDADCGPTVGETCVGGLCGVVCTPGGVDDCGAVGMAGATCLQIAGANVCGYR